MCSACSSNQRTTQKARAKPVEMSIPTRTPPRSKRRAAREVHIMTGTLTAMRRTWIVAAVSDGSGVSRGGQTWKFRCT